MIFALPVHPKRSAHKEKVNSGNTSWYAEHILFNQSSDSSKGECILL